jgi:hypothetical protein
MRFLMLNTLVICVFIVTIKSDSTREINYSKKYFLNNNIPN